MMPNATKTIQKVAILGAGASADAGAPLISNFFTKVEQLIKEKRFTDSEEQKFRAILEKRKCLMPNSNIEEFLSYVDFQSQFDVLTPQPTFVKEICKQIMNKNDTDIIPVSTDLQQAGYRKKDFETLKENTSFLISRTLDETMKYTRPKVVESYKKLIQEYDVVITFNWDVLYESVYYKETGKRLSIEQLGFIDLFKKPTLLKLHGSFSWAICDKCGLHLSDGKIEHKIHDKGMICSFCNKNELRPVSILPMLTKFGNISKIEYPPYRNMWYLAQYALTEAKTIRFFGYSLSDADVHTKIFFKSCILRNTNEKMKIYVVDKECDEMLMKRYSDAFNSRTKPIFIKKSFVDFFEDL